MRKIFIGLAVLVVAVVLIAVLVPLLVPADAYRGRIVEAVQGATGREFRIDGPLSFEILPSVAIEANGVALANAPGDQPKDMATLGKLQVGLKLFPLLGGDVEIDRFVLVDPVIHLVIDKSGRPNWDFSTAPPQQGASGPASQPAVQSQTRAQSQSLRQLHLGEVRLVNGTIDYSDERSGEHQEISQIGMTIKLPGLDEASSIDGSLVWRSKTVKLTASADRPRALFGSGTSAVKASLSSDPVTLSYDGAVTGGNTLALAGSLAVDVPSVRDLMAWTGNDIAVKGSGLGPFSLRSKLSGSPGNLAARDLTLNLDSIKATGELAVDATGARPSIKGKLDVGMLDLNPYLGGGGKAAQPPPPPGQSAPLPENGWSARPIDVSALKSADVDFSISANGIRYEKIEVGKSALQAQLRDGRLTADLGQLALYDGSGKGKVVIDATGSVPAIEATFDLSGVQAAPLLTAAIDFSRVTGVGSFDFALSSRGASQRNLVGALGGKGSFALKNGAIKGLDLLAMVKNISQSFSAATGGASGQTAFSDLAGTFTIANGVLKNDDLALKSPALQLSGAGTVDLPQRRIDYRIQPDIGIGGSNVAVPVLISGPWSNLGYQPDLKSILSQKLGKPGNLLQGLKGMAAPRGGSGSSGPAGVLKGLFGGK